MPANTYYIWTLTCSECGQDVEVGRRNSARALGLAISEMIKHYLDAHGRTLTRDLVSLYCKPVRNQVTEGKDQTGLQQSERYRPR